MFPNCIFFFNPLPVSFPSGWWLLSKLISSNRFGRIVQIQDEEDGEQAAVCCLVSHTVLHKY